VLLVGLFHTSSKFHSPYVNRATLSNETTPDEDEPSFSYVEEVK